MLMRVICLLFNGLIFYHMTVINLQVILTTFCVIWDILTFSVNIF